MKGSTIAFASLGTTVVTIYILWVLFASPNLDQHSLSTQRRKAAFIRSHQCRLDRHTRGHDSLDENLNLKYVEGFTAYVCILNESEDEQTLYVGDSEIQP